MPENETLATSHNQVIMKISDKSQGTGSRFEHHDSQGRAQSITNEMLMSLKIIPVICISTGDWKRVGGRMFLMV